MGSGLGSTPAPCRYLHTRGVARQDTPTARPPPPDAQRAVPSPCGMAAAVFLLWLGPRPVVKSLRAFSTAVSPATHAARPSPRECPASPTGLGLVRANCGRGDRSAALAAAGGEAASWAFPLPGPCGYGAPSASPAQLCQRKGQPDTKSRGDDLHPSVLRPSRVKSSQELEGGVQNSDLVLPLPCRESTSGFRINYKFLDTS